MIAIPNARLDELACGPAIDFRAGPANGRAAGALIPPIALLGVPFDKLTMNGALERIERMIVGRQPHYVVTANADFLVQARRDVELRRILREAHLVLCDGTPLLWASRLLGNPLPERVAGSDLAPLLIERAAQKGYRLFLLGASPEANAQAVERLKKRHPTLNIVGNHSPAFQPLLQMDHAEIKRRISAARPDLLFVSLGCPKQEKWIAMHYHALGVPVTIGVGATIDFLAGRVKRAPRWMQRAGLEWAFRLLQEPRRLFKRYLADLWHFSGATLAQCWEMQWRPGGPRRAGPSSFAVVERKWQRVHVSERLDIDSIRRDEAVWERLLTCERHGLLDLTGVRFIDSTGIGLLLFLRKQLHRAGRHLILIAPSTQVRRALRWLRLEECFELATDALDARAIITRRDQEKATPVLVTDTARSLAWQGEITADNAERVWSLTREPLNRLCALGRKISIDLSEVRFVDGTGLGVMVRARELAERQGGCLRFAEAQPAVRNVLNLATLDSLLMDSAA
jgi:N-acetylglucosaminyldiphosphoundecaprenol N-acetyl-beta-D-mannosaminyltransferase